MTETTEFRAFESDESEHVPGTGHRSGRGVARAGDAAALADTVARIEPRDDAFGYRTEETDTGSGS